MNNIFKQKLQKIKGYTLIEIMVVIAIIGVLSTVAVISFSGIRSKERDTRRLTDMKKISFGMEKYRSLYGEYPPCGSGCSDVLNSGWFSCLGESLKPFIGNIPVDPLNRYSYCVHSEYRSSGNQLSISYGLENDNPNIDSIGEKNYLFDFYGVRVYSMIIQPYGVEFNQY